MLYPHPIPKCALAPGPWVEVEQRKDWFRQEGRETGGIQAWLGEIPDLHLLCSTVFLAKPWSRAECDPEQAELVVGPGRSADVWGVLGGSVSRVYGLLHVKAPPSSQRED